MMQDGKTERNIWRRNKANYQKKTQTERRNREREIGERSNEADDEMSEGNRRRSCDTETTEVKTKYKEIRNNKSDENTHTHTKKEYPTRRKRRQTQSVIKHLGEFMKDEV